MQVNKPRNLKYFGDDAPDADQREKKEPSKIFGIETRTLAAVALLAGASYWVFTHDPLANLGKVPVDPEDEEDRKRDRESLLRDDDDIDDLEDLLEHKRDDGLEDDWLIDDTFKRGKKTKKQNGFGFRVASSKSAELQGGGGSLPRVRRVEYEEEAGDESEDEDYGDVVSDDDRY